MNIEKNNPRLLGAAFLFVFIASLVSTQLLTSSVGTSSISDILINISTNIISIHMSILIGLATSVGIVVLTVLLYVLLHKQNTTIALVAMGWWLAEAIILAISKIGLIALIPLSVEFIELGAPSTSHFQTFGYFLYAGIYQQGDNIHMLFYSLGGILWFYLFYISRYIPRVVSILGILIESVGLIGMILLLLSLRVSMFVFYPIALLEVVIGLWLMVKGINDGLEMK